MATYQSGNMTLAILGSPTWGQQSGYTTPAISVSHCGIFLRTTRAADWEWFCYNPKKLLFNSHLGYWFGYPHYTLHIDLLTPPLSSKERLEPWLNVQSRAHPFR